MKAEYYKNTSLENIIEVIDGVVCVEEWKDVVGYERLYKISNFGRIKSLNRDVYHSPNKTLKVFESIRKQVLNISNYPTIGLCNGRNKTHLVHRLVAVTFIPNPENKPEVNHIDFNPQNATVRNLNWATSLENKHHSIRMGRYVGAHWGERAGRAAKLKAKQVLEIRSRLANGEKAYEIYLEYGVSKCTIYGIKNRTSWASI